MGRTPKTAARTKKLKKGIILFHGSPRSWSIPNRGLRGPAWFTTRLKTAIWYAAGLWKKKNPTPSDHPGVLTYEVTRPVTLLQYRDGNRLDIVFDLLVKQAKILTYTEWSILSDTIEWSGLSDEEWSVKEVLDHPDYQGSTKEDDPEFWSLIDKMKRYKLDSVVGAIQAACKSSGFAGWTLQYPGGWEVMLCDPSKVLKRTDVWDVVKTTTDDPDHGLGWKALTPAQLERAPARVASRYAAARVADRYASSPLIKELEEDYHSLWHDKREKEGEPEVCPLKAGVPDCGKMTLKEFIAKWKKHGLKAVKVQRLPTRYSYYDCGSHAQLRAEQIHGTRDISLGWDTPIPWSKAKKGDWVKWRWHHGVVIDPKRKIVESCWGVDGWVFQHPVDLTTYNGKPTVHSVNPRDRV